MEELMQQQRSLAETPTYSVASVVTVMWLKKTRRKALFASLEKIKEELMLLGLISLLLAQCARWISEICVDSSLFTSRFYICSEKDYEISGHTHFESPFSSHNETTTHQNAISSHSSHQCGEGREPFVSYEGLEQLHRFLFVLGITHVLYSCVAVGLAMSKLEEMGKSGYFARYTFYLVLLSQIEVEFLLSVLILNPNMLLCFLRQFKSSIQKSDYMALRLGFITVLCHKGAIKPSWPLWGYAIICIFVNIHGLNIYFWLSFIPAIVSRRHDIKFVLFNVFQMPKLVMVVGTKLRHVVSCLALGVVEQTGPSIAANQIKPRDDLFWFGKPVILLRLIQFIIFQNAFEMATFIWSLEKASRITVFIHGLGPKKDCIPVVRIPHMKNTVNELLFDYLLNSFFWCSYSTVPLNIIVTQMGSRFKKALVAESVRESLHSWCKRVKEKSKRESLHSHTTRSVCSLESTIYEGDEITIASGTLSRSTSLESQNQLTVTSNPQPEAEAKAEAVLEIPNIPYQEYSFRLEEYLSESVNISSSQTQTPTNGEEASLSHGDEDQVMTLFELFKNT
ncbi:hypothetical protein F8388_003321 [Cannabis sativa]|uniref:MLO-like protein n=1 Tax=Cannabis sativa TaxID=3483 RepID=A0A7J6EFS9_CANSA|nr:hypothetical protein F8388_003321 [Cannabis sativa]